MLHNKKITVQYVGSNYAGWQVQKNARTVQEEIQKALSRMYKEDIKIVGSGRTDSGVHAIGQTASFRTERYLSDDAVLMGLNSLLPDDISISEVSDVPMEFHAQTSAKSKTYLYKIHASNVRNALYNGRAWWVKYELNYSELENYLKIFEGTHDFTSFCVQTSLKDNNIRTINYTKCYMENDLICLEINGNGFLHNMVRIIAGTIVEAVKKGLGEDYISEALEARDRNKAGPTGHADGLYLKQVHY